MIRKCWLGLMALAICGFASRTVPAQFGGLFGGLFGGRSGASDKQLAGQGVKVKHDKGSILQWVDAELPLVTLDGKPTNRVHTYSDRYKIPSKHGQVTQ